MIMEIRAKDAFYSKKGKRTVSIALWAYTRNLQCIHILSFHFESLEYESSVK